jgi:hypothetical protein
MTTAGVGGVVVVINADGSVYPFTELFNPSNESDDELRDLIDNYLGKQGRKIGTFYKVI